MRLSLLSVATVPSLSRTQLHLLSTRGYQGTRLHVAEPWGSCPVSPITKGAPEAQRDWTEAQSCGFESAWHSGTPWVCRLVLEAQACSVCGQFTLLPPTFLTLDKSLHVSVVLLEEKKKNFRRSAPSVCLWYYPAFGMERSAPRR